MALLRNQFSDLFFATALPVLEETIMEKYKSKPDMIPMVFNVESSDKWGEQDTTISGLGLAVGKGENAPVTYDDVLQGYDKTYTHATYALALRVSKEMIDDDKWGVVKKATSALGRSMFNTRQIIAAAHFNNAFNAAFPGPDGLELCSLLHPLIGGGTEQNELTAAADLSVTSLRQAINDIEDTVDDRSLLINITPRYLLVPNELKWDCEELLKSSLRPDNANNAINAFQMQNLDYLVWNYLTDPDAWFILSDKSEHSLKWYDRESVNTSSDYDFDARASKTMIASRFSSGWSEFRGVFGSPGA